MKAELEAQKALGQQSRSLQRQLKERDAEVAQLKSQAEEATSQLSSAQTEVKALQTKLAAARNTAASLENAAIKMPGSAIKSGANRANAAAVTAEAAQAAQFAQLKEDLYTDLTGLIIRDVKKRPSDNLYDCIQTGSNGSKLTMPPDGLIQVSNRVQPFISSWLCPTYRRPTLNLPSFNISHCWMRTETVSWLMFFPST